jgi:hypothetical protein
MSEIKEYIQQRIKEHIDRLDAYWDKALETPPNFMGGVELELKLCSLRAKIEELNVMMEFLENGG